MAKAKQVWLTQWRNPHRSGEVFASWGTFWSAVTLVRRNPHRSGEVFASSNRTDW